MKEKNRIDEFFAKSFEEMVQNEDPSLAPPEFIWENASKQFPKKKKKRRFFFLIFLGGFIALSAIGVFLLKTEENIPNKIAVQKGGIQTIDQNESIFKGLIDKGKKETKATIDLENNLNTSKNRGNDITPNTEKDVISREKKSNSTPSSNQRSTLEYTDTHELKNENLAIPSLYKQAAKADAVDEFLPTQGNIELANVSVSQLEQESEKINEEKEEPLNQEKELVAISSLEPRMSSELEYESDQAFFDFKKVVPFAVASPNWMEVGVSHRLLVINAVQGDIITEDQHPKDMIHVSNKYINLNLDFSKKISNRWTFSTGLWYSDLDLHANISVFDELDVEGHEYLRRELNELAFTRNDDVDRISSELVLQDGTILNIGDELNIKADIALELKAIQIPLMLDYHIEKKHVEWIFGGGFTLEHITVDQQAFNLDILKDGQKINQPLLSEEYFETAFDASVYGNIGFRYKLSQNFNIGLTTRIAFLQPIFSGIEGGIYYRI